MTLPEKTAVIGAGSWGTALAILLANKGFEVDLCGHRPEQVEALRSARENTTYLPGFPLPDKVRPTADLLEAVSGKPVVVMVVPSHVYREVFTRLAPHLAPDAAIISATKGIENETLLTMNQVMAEVLARENPGFKGQLGVLAGPSFAREVAAGIPTAVTVAANTIEGARFFQNIFHTERFRVYAGTDVIGLELGGALKNIVAIAAGICDGLGYGTNTRAALITRGLAEITRLGVAMGAKPRTFSGLAGMGDLVLTCTGDLSRNRQVGLKLGQGKTLAQILAEMEMVAEGIKTTRSARALALKIGVEMPILEEVHAMLYEDKPCGEAVQSLLGRDQKEEIEEAELAASEFCIPIKSVNHNCHPSGLYVAILFSIHYVLKAEQLLRQRGISLDVVPVPREISGDCGMAITFASTQLAEVQAILDAANIVLAKIFHKEAEGVFHEIQWKKQ